MTDTPGIRMDRANQVDQALNVLDPAFDKLISASVEALREAVREQPGSSEVARLAMVANIAEDVRNMLKAVVADGDMARDELKRRARVAAMSPEQRRYAEMLG